MAPSQREQEIKRAAEIKAAVVAYLNSYEGKVAFGHIESAVEAQAHRTGYNLGNLRNLVTQLVNNKLIRATKDGRYLAYSSVNVIKKVAKDLLTGNNNDFEKVAKPKKIKPTFKDLDAMQIDIVKSTGRVRLSIKGLIIEIGVVD